MHCLMHLHHIIKAKHFFRKQFILLQCIHHHIVAIDGQGRRYIGIQDQVRWVKNIIMKHEAAWWAVKDAHIIVILHFLQGNLYQFVIPKVYRCHSRRMIHKLVGKRCVITDDVDMVTFCGVNDIIDRDVSIEQAAMRIVVVILPVEKETASSLRVKIP